MRNALQQALLSASLADEQQVAAILANALLEPSTLLIRFWLVDHLGNLQLSGSAGTPSGGGSYHRLDGQFSCITKGSGKIGRIAATSTPLVVRGIRGDEEWLTNPGWISRQGVRAFAGYPMVANDKVVGVMAIFDRALPRDEVLDEWRFVAAFGAARVHDLRSRCVTRDLSTPRISSKAEKPSALASAAMAGNPARKTPHERPDAGLIVNSLASEVLTREELRMREKQNIAAALARTNGTVFGPTGAAALLGMRPTTLASRIKALKIR